ncbi:hypothetical protein L615_009000000190 [Nocardioides sp. J9]|nr:hypothetical protein L615_009000000190 [Nocardioides sp. J9]
MGLLDQARVRLLDGEEVLVGELPRGGAGRRPAREQQGGHRRDGDEREHLGRIHPDMLHKSRLSQHDP